MSKFMEQLTRVSAVPAQPMGFRRQSQPERPRIQLVASLGQGDAVNAERVAGADAALLRVADVTPGLKLFAKLVKAAPDVPWGIWLNSVDEKTHKQLGKLENCDFFVFPRAGTPLGLSPGDEGNRVLEVEATIEEGLLRAVDKLPIEAVLLGGMEAKTLTWHDLNVFRYFAGYLTKPVLVPVAACITPGEIQMLWDAGLDGIIIAAEESPDCIKQLRDTIDTLEYPSPRKTGKLEAVLPRVAPEAPAAVDEEEEEEDE